MSQSMTAFAPKRKNPTEPSDADHASKKARKEAKKEKKEKKDKSSSKKHRHSTKVAVDHVASSSSDSEFHSVKASVQLTIPPVFATKPHEGAQELLDSMIMRYVCCYKSINRYVPGGGVNNIGSCPYRYIPALRGVVLAHKGLQFLESTGKLKADSPFSICKVGFEAIVWSPEIGMELGAHSFSQRPSPPYD